MKNRYVVSCLYLNLYFFAAYLKNLLRKVEVCFAGKRGVSENLNSFIEHSSRKFPERRSESKILMDVFPIPDWIFVNAVLANEICDVEGAEIESYSRSGRDLTANLLYKSFGCKKHHVVRLQQQEKKDLKNIYQHAVASIKSKKDLLDYEVDGVRIGLDVYETILINCKVPTVDIDHVQTHRYLLWGIVYYLFAKRLFSSGRHKAVLLSHDNYIWMGTIAKVAYRYGLPVYLANSREIIKTLRVHHLYERLLLYPKLFQRLGEEQKEDAIEWSRAQLQSRFSGKIGVQMDYQIKSAFGAHRIRRQTQNNDKPKIVIATHCFYDNPHGLGWMLFPDFYEWIRFLGKLSHQLDYDFYIKAHPDYLPGTMDVVRELCGEFRQGSVAVIDPATTWHQLKEEGVNTVLTCYGSIGHELPLIGFNVVNAAYNPHIAYNFNAHPRGIEEYESILRNIENLKIDVNESEIYEFFYVHKKLTQPDDVFFTSTKAYLDAIAEAGAGEDVGYEIYLQQQQFDAKVRSYFRKLNEKQASFIYE